MYCRIQYFIPKNEVKFSNQLYFEAVCDPVNEKMGGGASIENAIIIPTSHSGKNIRRSQLSVLTNNTVEVE